MESRDSGRNESAAAGRDHSCALRAALVGRLLCVRPHIRERFLTVILPASRPLDFPAGHEHMNRVPMANSLLAALPRKDCQRLLAGLEPVTLTFGEILYEPGKPIQHVYFPTDALVSLLTVVDGHMAIEIGLVGREGMLGI